MPRDLRPDRWALHGGLLVAVVVLLLLGRLLASAGLFVLAVNVVFFPDLLDTLIRIYVRAAESGRPGLGVHPGPSVALEVGDFSPGQKRLHLRPMVLAASVHNAEDELDGFMTAMEPYGRYLWTIDDASTDETVLRLRHAGCRCLVGSPNRKKPGAIRELVENLPPEIHTVVVFDPDCSFAHRNGQDLSDLETVVFDFQQSGMAAACPRVAVKPDGIIGDFQGFEYCLSQLLGRKSLRDFSITSGIAIYRRADLEWVLGQHSLSVYAEDLENTVLLLASGRRVYYDDRLVVETEGKLTLGGLFSQRVGWAYGHIRVFFERFTEMKAIAARGPMAAYQYLVYLGIIGIALLPIRALGAIAILLSLLNGVDDLFLWGLVPNVPFADPLLFLTVYVQYLLVTILVLFTAVPAEERSRFVKIAPLYMFYALFLIVPTTVGFANWLTLRFLGRRVFQDHYQEEEGVVHHVNGRPQVQHA